MQGHDLRKLITTFLVLALLAGSASLAITSLARQKSEGATSILGSAKDAAGEVPKIGDKALVEALPQGSIAGYDLAKEFSPTTNPDDNYTDNLAKGLAYEFVTANPNGPDAANGLGIVTPPNIEDVMDEYVTEASLSPTTYAIDESRIKVTKNYTKEQVDTYTATLSDVFAKASESRNIGGLIERTAGVPDPASLQASNFILSEAQARLYDVTVPEPAAEINRAALSYLELNRKLSDLDYTTDPLKAIVFIEKFPELRAREEARLRLAVDTLAMNESRILADAHQPFKIAHLLGINTAHALLGIGGGVPVTDSGNWITNILNGVGIYGNWADFLITTIKNTALQILKNQLVGRMIQQTIKWVQGGGKPQFITNWKSFLKDTATGAADEAISRIAPKLCSNFKAFTSNFTRQTTDNGISGSRDPTFQITCTLDQVVQNVKSFYDDFRNGGWAALAAVQQPENNVWGSLILAHEAVTQQAAAEQAAQSQNVAANQGFTGLTRCVAYEIETIPESELAARKKLRGYYGQVGQCFSQTETVPGTGSQQYCINNPNADGCQDYQDPGDVDIEVRYCDIKVCAPDGEQATTPGGFVADQLGKAVGGSLDNIVNANDLAGLVGVLVDSAITRLTSAARNGLLGLFDGGSSGGSDTGTGSGGGTGGSGGGGSESQQDLNSMKAQANQLISAYNGRIAETRARIAEWLPLANTTRPLLTSVGMTCLSYSTDATQRIEAIGRVEPKVVLDAQALEDIASSIATTSASIQSATSAIALVDLISELNAQNSNVANLSTRSASRVGQLRILQQQSNANLENRACNTPLAPIDE